MLGKGFFKARHTLTLFAAFFYFDMAFIVWVGQKGFMVAIPILAGALLRVPNGVLVDHIKPKLTGLIGQVVVLLGLTLIWFIGVSSFAGILAVSVVLWPPSPSLCLSRRCGILRNTRRRRHGGSPNLTIVTDFTPPPSSKPRPKWHEIASAG